MAINKNSDNSLSINDILRQVGITPGTTIDFASLGTLLGAGNSNHVLPDSFVGKTLTLSANSISVSPSGTLAFAIAGETKTITVTTNGVFLITDIPSWLSVSPIAATGTTAVRLYASPNSDLGTNSRTATLNFLGSANTSITTKGLSQNGNPVTAQISGDTTISGATTTRNIVLTLSNQLSVTSVSLTNTTGFSINTTPTTSVGATTTTYTYTLTITAATTGNSKESTAEFFVGGAGYSTTLRSKTTQSGLSNFTTSDITLTGFAVSSGGVITAPTVTTTGTNISITYTTAENSGTSYTLAAGFPLVSSVATRWANVTVTVPAGYGNTGSPITKSISAEQAALSNFTEANISLSGFSVSADGVITGPTTATPAGTTHYSTDSANLAANRVTKAAGFQLEPVNTTRYCTHTVVVPSGYFNVGQSVSKQIEAIQPEKFYGSDEISIGFWSVDEFGTISEPLSVSATGLTSADISVTYDGGATVARGYQESLTQVTRTAYATVTVPSGWYNSGESQSTTRTAIQPATELTGWLYMPHNTTTEREGWNPGGINGSYSNYAFWSATDSTDKYLSFSLRTNVQVEYQVVKYTGVNYTIVQPTNDFALLDNRFITYPTISSDTTVIPTSATSFRLKITAPGQNQSTTTTLYFTTVDTSIFNKNFEVTITLGRAADTGGGVEPLVTPTVKGLPPPVQA